MIKMFRRMFLVSATCLLLVVHGLQFDASYHEEDEHGPLVSLLKSSADRVIANAPIIINRESELYQRYWKQRLPRRVSLKQIHSEEEDAEKVQNEIENVEELINSVPESLPLVQSKEDEDISSQGDDHQALASIVDETVVQQDQQVNQNQVSLSHDEPGTSLADQLAELEVVEDEVNESNYLPSGDLLRLPDGSRNYSSLLVKIKEQRQIRLAHIPPTVQSLPAATQTSVPQLSGQFVHASRYRSLPASRFESGFPEQQPVKIERVDFSYKPLPEEAGAPVPTGGLGTLTGFSGDLGTISIPDEELETKSVFSRDTFGDQQVPDALQETLFRHQVEQQSFEGTTASSHVASPYETVVTPPTTTPATVFFTESPFKLQPEPKQVENVALGQVYNGGYVATPAPRPFEPLYQPEILPVAANNYQLPVSQTSAAVVVQNQYNVETLAPISYRPQQNFQTNQNFGGYQTQHYQQVGQTTPHPLIYGFQPVTSSKISYSGSGFLPPVPIQYSGNFRAPPQSSQGQQQQRATSFSKHVRFPSFFF